MWGRDPECSLLATVPGRLLPRRALCRAVRAEYTTIAGPGPEHRVARRALVEVQARVGGHLFGPPVPAERTGEGRLENTGNSDQPVHHHHLDIVADLDRALLMPEHDEAVRFRHRAQDPRALRAGEAHAPFAAFQFQYPALVFGAARFLAHRRLRFRAQERQIDV